MQIGTTRPDFAYAGSTPAISAVPGAVHVAADASPRRERQERQPGGDSVRIQLAEVLGCIDALEYARQLNLQLAELLNGSGPY